MHFLLPAAALLGLLSGLRDLPFILAGHGYDTGGQAPREPRGDVDDGGGIGTASIVAVLLVTLATVGLLLWLNRSTAIAKLKGAALMALPIALITAPLVAWAVSSSGAEERSLIVERATGLTGARELLVSLVEDDLNTLETTNGRKAVRVVCVGREGQVVLEATQRWPFIIERGYDYPHAHQAASPEQVRQADRCRLRDTRVRLETDVTGPLTG